MNLTEVEQCVYAYFLHHEALKVTVDGRFYKAQEFVRKFENEIMYGTPSFGGVDTGRPSTIATCLVDSLIEEGALSSVNDELSGISYQFDSARYKAFIKDQIATNAICKRAAQGGPRFWEEAFASLKKE
jgi:hypothetical protein